MPEILPDCRTHEPRGAVSGRGDWSSWIPIFCANCGREGGKVPEENMTGVFWLCNACFETYGPIAATMILPDEIFWEEIRLEQMKRDQRQQHESR